MRIALDDFMKIRAVQDFAPSQAAGFIFSLRRIMIEELGQKMGGTIHSDEVLELQTDLDAASLAAFEAYTDAREKIFRIRVNEMKSKSADGCAGKQSS